LKILILGSGGREHALAWKFSESKRISGLFIAPGNAGTAELGTNLSDIDPCDPAQVVKACKENGITHVFVGPETPLAAGVVDALKDAGIPAIGPDQSAARLESSKSFSKNFMLKHHIPTAACKQFEKADAFIKHLSKVKGKIVLKKSGLAAGKGVLESDNHAQLEAFGREVLKNDILVVEEFLEGWECSIFVLLDGKNYLVLPPCADFKKAGNGDTGLNTGGMGSICPVPWVTSSLMSEIEKKCVIPTIAGLTKEKLFYKGVIYIGIMITATGPKVLEYNVRFGDPETQVLMASINYDMGDLVQAMIDEKLNEYSYKPTESPALGVVVAAPGYPGNYPKNLPVKPIPDLSEDDVFVFHASTALTAEGQLVTTGGRCFTVVAKGEDHLSANAKVYHSVPKIEFEGAWYRTDIGHKFIKE
jgi:phosphoribosylamine--glycine ligase